MYRSFLVLKPARLMWMYNPRIAVLQKIIRGERIRQSGTAKSPLSLVFTERGQVVIPRALSLALPFLLNSYLTYLAQNSTSDLVW